MLMAVTFADWLQWKVSNPAVLQSTSPFCLVPLGKSHSDTFESLDHCTAQVERWLLRAVGTEFSHFIPIMKTPLLNSKLKITTLGSAERCRHMFLSEQSLPHQKIKKIISPLLNFGVTCNYLPLYVSGHLHQNFISNLIFHIRASFLVTISSCVQMQTSMHGLAKWGG